MVQSHFDKFKVYSRSLIPKYFSERISLNGPLECENLGIKFGHTFQIHISLPFLMKISWREGKANPENRRSEFNFTALIHVVINNFTLLLFYNF